jgi:hypothetical protein
MQQAVAGGQLQQATVVEQQTVVMEKETSAGNDGFKDASKMSSCVDIEPQPQPQRSPPSGFWSCLYRALDVCDHLGERIADFLGITSPRFQYVIDEHNRIEKRKKEKAEKELRARLKREEKFTNLEAQHPPACPQSDPNLVQPISLAPEPVAAVEAGPSSPSPESSGNEATAGAQCTNIQEVA